MVQIKKIKGKSKCQFQEKPRRSKSPKAQTPNSNCKSIRKCIQDLVTFCQSCFGRPRQHPNTYLDQESIDTYPIDPSENNTLIDEADPCVIDDVDKSVKTNTLIGQVDMNNNIAHMVKDHKEYKDVCDYPTTTKSELEFFEHEESPTSKKNIVTVISR